LKYFVDVKKSKGYRHIIFEEFDEFEKEMTARAFSWLGSSRMLVEFLSPVGIHSHVP
jgi:hypothetical protein